MTRKRRIREISSLTPLLSSAGDKEGVSIAGPSMQGGEPACGRVRSAKHGRREVLASACVEPVLDSGVDALRCHQNNVGQAAYQRGRRIRGSASMYQDMGDMTNICIDCDAMYWSNESKQVPKNSALVYTECCKEGRVRLPSARPTPAFLEELLDPRNGGQSSGFRENIRAYNTMFAFTSIGANVDPSVTDGLGPSVYKICGQVYHLMGSLIPPEGESPKFAQLYIYDTQNEVENRQRVVQGLNEFIVQGLITMFNETNELVRFYRTIRDKYDDRSLRSLSLTILDNERAKERQYQAPASSEVAGLIVGDVGMFDSERDVVVENNNNKLQRVSKIHVKYMSFQYPVLFPYGEDGFINGLKLLPPKGNRRRNREKMSMRAFVSYYIHEREHESSTLLKGGRLFQQYLVDAYATVEETRLFFLRKNNDQYRCETLEGIYDTYSNGHNDGRNVGKRVILPSSHTGSPRYMAKHYQDAMSICRQYGHPDLFITFTCNPKWPEIIRALEHKHSNKPEDRPDIVSRVFKMKHDDLIEYVKSGKPFGKVIAELPDRNIDPLLYEIVGQSMIHGPCGELNFRSPCMKNNKCTKSFPREYVESTSFEPNKFPVYRRRDDDTKFFIKNNVKVDNGFVVPYNRELLLRYNAHINVEYCSQSMLIKYLFKYINKGPDRARVGIKADSNDEIANYLNCRYISPCEATWRLFEYPIHSRHPAVELLHVHLPGQQSIVFNESQPLSSVVSRQGEEDTMLTAWFKANANKETKDKAKGLTYAEFPSQFVWDNHNKTWNPRQRGYVLGRVANVPPTSGELYYLRLLLNTCKGCKSFADIRKIRGVVQPSFQDACRTLGLLGDDKEWSEALTNAIPTATSPQLRHLFVTLLLYCNVSVPRRLLDTYWRNMCDDILYNLRSQFGMADFTIPDSDLLNSLLFELEQLLSNASTSLEKYKLPMPNEQMISELNNRQLREELDYDRVALEKEHSILVSQLNVDQKVIYDNVVHTVQNKSIGCFFVYGHGGTGKTFLWHTIINRLRSEGKIVLAVASSGIASLLSPNGRTAHSRFKIPLDIKDRSSCSITKGTHLAKLIEKTDLIIWDEAPMANKYCFESLDYSLRDILSESSTIRSTLPFGGMPIVLGGDFRQILPVVRGKTKAHVIDASLNNSYLWPMFKVFCLTENMRLSKPNMSIDEKERIAKFAKWLLEVGDGKVCDIKDPDDSDAYWIEIPNDMLIATDLDPISSIFHATYPDFDRKYNNFDYIRERTIITPKNVTVSDINDYAVSLLPDANEVIPLQKLGTDCG
uniref:uncharacterized protein LOC101290818 n=1 Tax=Fragaria vesca subsp. vesca TaxID=101020 RepID=UPI0005CABD5C|nr:PREDICTED: uncharacterized protein LOC101290818 [Fragaria vesca subsp. vesca]